MNIFIAFLDCMDVFFFMDLVRNEWMFGLWIWLEMNGCLVLWIWLEMNRLMASKCKEY